MRTSPLSIVVLFAACLAGTRAFGVEIEAGPIWADQDANNKCPQVCASRGGQWTGQWRTTQPGRMSVCDCKGVAPPQPSILPYPASSGVARYSKTEFVGYDIGSTAAASFDRCASFCVANSSCVAFSLRAGTCTFKSRVGGITQSPFVDSGFIVARGSPPQGYVAPQSPAPAMTPNSCSVGGTTKCPGCSVACNPGERPVCTPPFDGVASFCQRDASCTCAPN